MNERIFNRILAGRVASGKWQKYMSISRAERVAKSDVSDKFVTGWSEAETGEELRPHGTSNLEPKFFASNNLESFFSPTVSHEVHHQNVKHQQHRSERNP